MLLIFQTRFDMLTMPGDDGHQHEIRVPYENMLELKNGEKKSLSRNTVPDDTHRHAIRIFPVWDETEGENSDNDFDILGVRVILSLNYLSLHSHYPLCITR